MRGAGKASASTGSEGPPSADLRGRAAHAARAARTAALLLLLASLLLPRPAAALDPGRALSQYQVDTWQTEHGLPQNTVTSIVRTRDGNLWFGTYEGLVRFDGASFAVFDAKTTPVLAVGSTLSLMEDRAGGLWIGRSENVVRYEGGVFREVIDAKATGQGSVWSFCEAPDGTVWAAGSKGLVRWKGGQATLLTKKDGLPVERLRSVCLDRDGTLWVGTNGGGLCSYRDGKFTVRSTKEGFPDARVQAVLPDPSGGIWASTAGGGLVRINGSQVRLYGRADGLPTEQLTALALDAHGALWIGTWGSGISVLRNGVFSSLGPPALSNDQIWSLLADEEGYLWVGTWVGGLNRLRDRRFAVHGVPEGLSNGNVRSVLHGRDGSVWLATAGGGLNRIRGERVEAIREADGLPSDQVASLCEDRSGALWVGTNTGGLARLRAGRIDLYGKAEGLPSPDVRAILEDRDGTLWVGTMAGVARSRDGRRFEKLQTPEGVALESVISVLQDRSGVLWFATSGDGLVRYDGTSFRVLTTRDGLVSNRLMALFEDREGALWVGSAGAGINRLKDGRIAAIRPEDGLADGMVQCLLEDRLGGIWISGNHGFQRVPKSELSARADGRPGRIHAQAFGLADGLRSTTFASGQQPAGAVGPDGRIWLPSYRGVVVVDPARIPPSPPPPGVRAEEVLVDGVATPARSTLAIGPGRRNVEIRYAPTTLRPPELIRFRYRLDGFDGRWSEAGTRRAAYYTGLPPGKYGFRVASRIADGPWGTETVLLSLTVRPAFHESPWFRLLAAGLLVASAIGAYRVKTLQLRRRHDELEKVVAERTEELSRANELLSTLSLTDSLTGIANRRRFEEAFEAEWHRALRLNGPVSIVMADIDLFKSYNDALGHPAGDRCLAEVACVLQGVARRGGDLAARTGGEEFVLLLPDTRTDAAAALAETARKAVEGLRIPHPSGIGPFVTLSLGVATVVPVRGEDRQQLVEAVDEALYEAKRAGRNRVVVREPSAA